MTQASTEPRHGRGSHLFRRALRQVWMREIHDFDVVDALWRHPAMHDRSVLEVALSRRFFEPFDHQEVVTGPRFQARSRWSRMALAKMPMERVHAAASAAFDAEVHLGLRDSLLDTVRRVVVRAAVELALGDSHFVPVAQAAVADMDRGIKMIGPRHLELRRALASALSPFLADSSLWVGTTYLTVARDEALALPLQERIDHMAAVFLGTGSIQVSDVVTHALIAIAQHPGAANAGDAAIVAETIRLFPVNASTTRVPSHDVVVAGHLHERAEPVVFVPRRRAGARDFDPHQRSDSEGWSFGLGPRACPARRLAAALAATLLARFRGLGVRIEPGYSHRRSLALAVRASFGDSPPPSPSPRARFVISWARYLAVCLETYSATFVSALPELGRAVRS